MGRRNMADSVFRGAYGPFLEDPADTTYSLQALWAPYTHRTVIPSYLRYRIVPL